MLILEALFHVLLWLWAIFSDPLNGVGYSFWSGIGSGSPVLVALGAWWHHKNCHEHGCWRVSKHGKTHCKKHRHLEGA